MILICEASIKVHRVLADRRRRRSTVRIVQVVRQCRWFSYADSMAIINTHVFEEFAKIYQCWDCSMREANLHVSMDSNRPVTHE